MTHRDIPPRKQTDTGDHKSISLGSAPSTVADCRELHMVIDTSRDVDKTRYRTQHMVRKALGTIWGISNDGS
jgi:hypothetical protein